MQREKDEARVIIRELNKRAYCADGMMACRWDNDSEGRCIYTYDIYRGHASGREDCPRGTVRPDHDQFDYMCAKEREH
jgi:hypothetical protein